MRHHHLIVPAAVLTVVVPLAAACGGDDDDSAAGGGDGPTLVVTTPVLGDVVSELVGNDAEVTVVMPAGADPHEFQPSARQSADMREAELLITNGGGFEAGLEDTIEGAEADGATVFAAIDHVETLEAGEDAHGHEDEESHEDDADTHAEDETAEEAHADEEGEGDDHDHEGVDPHFFTDPARMAAVARALADTLADEVPELDTPELDERADAYVAELEALDAEVEETLAAVPAERRTLVTNHDVFGYFADRYDFEVVGTVIPSGSTQAGASGGELAELASIVEAEGIPAVFADTSSPEDLADALAAEAGSDVEVVELYSESLGEEGSDADTYVGMVRTNATRIADALAPA